MLKQTMTAAAIAMAFGLFAGPAVAQKTWDDSDGILMNEGSSAGGGGLGSSERRLDVPPSQMIPEGGIRDEDDSGVATTDDRDHRDPSGAAERPPYDLLFDGNDDPSDGLAVVPDSEGGAPNGDKNDLRD